MASRLGGVPSIDEIQMRQRVAAAGQAEGAQIGIVADGNVVLDPPIGALEQKAQTRFGEEPVIAVVGFVELVLVGEIGYGRRFPRQDARAEQTETRLPR